MKKGIKALWLFVTIFIGIGVVHAAPTSSLYASANYVESGSKVTATLRINNVAAWNVRIESSGATSGCDTSFADATSNGGNTTKYLTVTCTATSVGQISFRASGDATSSDGSTSTISAVKVVTVTAPRQKDSNNYLSSIGVTGYTLTPEFNQETLEYSVEVPSTVDKVTLEASAASNYASVSGNGEVEVNEGANAFEIKVTSETGVERIYKITVNVKDENPIEIKINNNSYTIMKNAKTIETPSTYEATTIKIDDFDIPAFYSETSTFTLIGVKDNKGDTYLAIYDKDKDSYELYNENKSDQLLLYIENIPEEKKGFIKSTITINNQSYECLTPNENSNLIIVYAMNIVTGKSNYYIYDKEENSYTLYKEEMTISLQEELEKYKMLIMGLGGGLIFSIFIIMCLILRKPKNKKKNKEEIKVNQIPTEESSLEKNIKKNKKQEEIKPKDKKVKTSEDALEKVDEATKMIENFEKTTKLSKKELAEAKESTEKKETSEIEATMYDILKEDKKKKKKRK